MNEIETGRRVLDIEARAIDTLRSRLNSSFTDAISLLYNCKGRVVVTGMGKSGLIGRKIAATFASTGTPAFFLHPAEGIHGDIGMIMPDDTIMAISNSGETDEILALLPVFKKTNLRMICLTGNTDSTLSKNSDVVLDISIEEEACPMNIVPTASTTATLAMGDAIAVTLLEKREFRKEDFALFHPGGALGREPLAVSEVQTMETYSITTLVILNEDTTVAGIIHLHDLLKKGIV